MRLEEKSGQFNLHSSQFLQKECCAIFGYLATLHLYLN